MHKYTMQYRAAQEIAFRRSEHRCEACGKEAKRLLTHHGTYERQGEERASDLFILCVPCHKQLHNDHALAFGAEVKEDRSNRTLLPFTLGFIAGRRKR